ncbi:MAG: alanine racemase [Janthinobacterium lividum]
MRSVLPSHTRPISAEISAANLCANFDALRVAAGPQVEVLAVIKADAYGHGAAECAPVLAAAGAHWLGVTSAEEGSAVRASLDEAACSASILVMCGIWPGDEAACLDSSLTPVVWESYHLDLLESEARLRDLPAQSVPVHVEIDTGMARQGVTPGDVLEALLARFTPDTPLLLEGVMTHLASTECTADPQNARQMVRFAEALAQVQAAGLHPTLIHAGNTSSTDSGFVPHELPELARSMGAQAMTRGGLALYGYALPLENGSPHLHLRLQTVLAWKTRVVSLRDVRAGDTVGYNAAFVAPGPMRLALLPVGYADGFRRGLSSSTAQVGGEVLLQGHRAPIVGRVSMDLTVVDVTRLPQVQIGDEAVLLGRQGTEHIGADEQARIAGTSAYEILCGISDRVPRILVA